MNPLIQSIWMLTTTILLVWILRLVYPKRQTEKEVLVTDLSKSEQIAVKLIQFAGSYSVYPFKSSGEIRHGMLTVKFWHKDDPEGYYCIQAVVDKFLHYEKSKNEIAMLFGRLQRDTFAKTN